MEKEIEAGMNVKLKPVKTDYGVDYQINNKERTIRSEVHY